MPADYTDEQLGLLPAVLPDYAPAQQFHPGRGSRLLEALYNGTQGVQFAQPRGGLESFLSGLTGSLAGQGAKVATARQKFEAGQNARRLLTDEQRRKATEDYNKRKADALGEVAKENRAATRKTAETTAEDARNAIPMTDVLGQRYPDLGKVYKAGDMIPERVMKQYTGETPSERVTAAKERAQGGMGSDAEDIADEIEAGRQPPDTKGLYRMGAPVRAALARRHFDLTAANKDWQAVTRSISTLNGTQQTRLRQAVETAYNSLDVIDQLNDQLSKDIPRGAVRAVNHAAMLAAMNGAFGTKAQQTATQLNGQITDVVSELGNAYMGGNSPTDHALALASKNLSGDWSHDQLKSMTGLARQNLTIRRNSIINAAPITPGSGNISPASAPLTDAQVRAEHEAYLKGRH